MRRVAMVGMVSWMHASALSLGGTSLARRAFMSRGLSAALNRPASPDPEVLEAVTKNWVMQWVHKHGLCPWSGQVLINNRLRIVSLASGPLDSEEAFAAMEQQFFDECKLLMSEDEKEKSGEGKPSHETTLIVAPHMTDFLEFLDVEEHLEVLLDEHELSGDIQVASFHPDYQFEGAGSDDVENYTNRSPYPLFHLLKVDQVANAIAKSNGDTSDVWERNIKLMKTLGLAKVQQVQRDIMAGVAIGSKTA